MAVQAETGRKVVVCLDNARAESLQVHQATPEFIAEGELSCAAKLGSTWCYAAAAKACAHARASDSGGSSCRRMASNSCVPAFIGFPGSRSKPWLSPRLHHELTGDRRQWKSWLSSLRGPGDEYAGREYCDPTSEARPCRALLARRTKPPRTHTGGTPQAKWSAVLCRFGRPAC